MQVRLEVSIIVPKPRRWWHRIIGFTPASRIIGRSNIRDDEGPTGAPLSSGELGVVGELLDELAAGTFLRFAEDNGTPIQGNPEHEDVRF